MYFQPLSTRALDPAQFHLRREQASSTQAPAILLNLTAYRLKKPLRNDEVDAHEEFWIPLVLQAAPWESKCKTEEEIGNLIPIISFVQTLHLFFFVHAVLKSRLQLGSPRTTHARPLHRRMCSRRPSIPQYQTEINCSPRVHPSQTVLRRNSM